MAGSVTGWIESLKHGSEEAAELIWDRLFERLKRRVSTYSRVLRLCDDEDIACSAFAEFYQAVHDGRFEGLANRDELWRLLATIAVRKSRDCHKYEFAARRGGTVETHSFDDFRDTDHFSSYPSASFFSDASPIAYDGSLAEIFNALNDATLCKVLQMKIDGHENKEIATEIGCSVRTIQYMIRDLTLKILEYGQSGTISN